MSAPSTLAFLRSNRPFPHSTPVSKHKEMRTRLGWTISYKSLYFTHLSLELVPLFTGKRERSITIVTSYELRDLLSKRKLETSLVFCIGVRAC